MAAGEILIKWVSESSAAIRDMKKVDRALGDTATQTERNTRRMATAHKVVNGALTAWMGTLVGVGYAYSGMVKSAMEDASAQAKLQTVARNSAKATGAQVDAMNDYIDAVAAATTYTDDQLRPAMASLVMATGDTTRAQDALKIAVDAAAASGKNVETVSTAIAKAYDGNTSSLKRLFPFLDDATIKSGDFSKIMAELRDNTKGAAKAGADKDQWTVFTQNLDELKESLGALATSKGGTKTLKDLNGYLLDIKGWVDANPQTFDIVAKGIAGVTAALVALKAALVVSGAMKTFLGILSSPFALAAGWVGFGQWLDHLDRTKGGLYTALAWAKKLADFLSNPVGNAMQIGWQRLVDAIRTGWSWIQKAVDALNLLRGGGGTPGITLGGTAGVSRAPTLASSQQVGRLQAVSNPVTNVWVAGQRQRARTVTSPWTPQISLGVI